MATEIELSKRGIEVVNIEPFDYGRFYQEGIGYLHSHFNKDTVRYYLERSNLLSVKDDIPEFLRLVQHETRRASIEDIDTMLEKGYLIGAEINSRVLNNKSGFSLHFVLIHGRNADNYTLNDPGGGSAQPLENRLVTKTDFLEALGGDGINGEVTGFKL